MLSYVNCNLCPNECGVDRTAGEFGFCGAPATALVAKTMLHEWEEPALSPNGKSGAIFFGGCTLGCMYCQNHAISEKAVGREVDSAGLRAIMEDLIAQGAENIDLVTPTHYLPTIIPALTPKLPVPVVYNCGGYESMETLKALEGLVDVYLPDMKYEDPLLAQSLSGTIRYPEVSREAILEMYRQTGDPQWEGDKMVRGTLIRHLILPGYIDNSLGVLDWIAEHFEPGQVLVSVMSQYTPTEAMKEYKDLNRKLKAIEHKAVMRRVYGYELEGFFQDLDSADEQFIPDF